MVLNGLQVPRNIGYWEIIEAAVQIVPSMDLCHKMECWRGFGFVIGQLVPGKYSDLIYAMDLWLSDSIFQSYLYSFQMLPT